MLIKVIDNVTKLILISMKTVARMPKWKRMQSEERLGSQTNIGLDRGPFSILHPTTFLWLNPAIPPLHTECLNPDPAWLEILHVMSITCELLILLQFQNYTSWLSKWTSSLSHWSIFILYLVIKISVTPHPSLLILLSTLPNLSWTLKMLHHLLVRGDFLSLIEWTLSVY